MTNEILLEKIKTAMQCMNAESTEHFLKLMPDILQCFTDKQFSATLIIKEAKEEFGNLNSINANEFEMNNMLFGICEVLGLLDVQKTKLPAYLN
jgi:hypothetical protein